MRRQFVLIYLRNQKQDNFNVQKGGKELKINHDKNSVFKRKVKIFFFLILVFMSITNCVCWEKKNLYIIKKKRLEQEFIGLDKKKKNKSEKKFSQWRKNFKKKKKIISKFTIMGSKSPQRFGFTNRFTVVVTLSTLILIIGLCCAVESKVST